MRGSRAGSRASPGRASSAQPQGVLGARKELILKDTRVLSVYRAPVDAEGSSLNGL